MRAKFEDSYRALPPDAARLLRLLGLQPGDDFGPAAAAVLADVPEAGARDLLRTLAEHGLVDDAGGGRYRLRGPVGDYAREWSAREDTGQERDAALHRVLDHYLAGGASGEAGLQAEGLALLHRERWTEAAEALEEGLRLAERDGDRRTVLLARHNLARALLETGALDRAIRLLGPLPDEFAALSDDHDRARALTTLGEAYLRAGRPVAATNFFGQALEIVRGEESAEQEGDAFVHIADAARERGDAAAEAAALDHALALYQKVPTPKADQLQRRRNNLNP
ncbi:tetratricopeptide repeat protein [Actinomadura napierensis]|uniref:Tetratricopeptide repeat protein n=1 Tax=Actinomadura napierensis TaxID=267854 RepID=A0ABP5KW57_9ACTN